MQQEKKTLEIKDLSRETQLSPEELKKVSGGKISRFRKVVGTIWGWLEGGRGNDDPDGSQSCTGTRA